MMGGLVWFGLARAALAQPSPLFSLPYAASAKLFWALLVRRVLFVLIVEIMGENWTLPQEC